MKRIIALLPALLLAACITGSGDTEVTSRIIEQQDRIQNQGSLVIARPLPRQNVESSSLFGFMPQKQQDQKLRLQIDIDSQTATVLKGALRLASYPVSGIEGLEPGNYEVLHKQRHPVWYATDEYFSNRMLPVPGKNARERYLKGALGDFVIFLDNKMPLHNSQVFAEEVGGVRMQDKDIAQIYYQLEVGAAIEVK